MKPEPLSCTPACCCQFDTAAVHPPPPSLPPEITPGIQTEVCGGALLKKHSTCYVRWLLLQRSFVIDV